MSAARPAVAEARLEHSQRRSRMRRARRSREAALRAALPILRPFVSAAVAESAVASADEAAKGAVRRWRIVEAQAVSALEHAAAARQLRLGDAAAGLARRIAEQVGRTASRQLERTENLYVLSAPD